VKNSWQQYVGTSAFAALLQYPIARGWVVWNETVWVLTDLGRNK
jgi:hypothetical protein